MKKALLVIDFINGIVRDGSCRQWAEEHPIVENVNRLIASAREQQVPIYFVRLGFDKHYSNLPTHSKLFNYVKDNGLFQLGEASTEFVSDLDYHQGEDIVINKTGASPFAGNDLEEQLRSQQLEKLIFCGVATDNAISAGVRYAHDKGFYTVIVEDTCGAGDKAFHHPIVKALEKIANEVIDTDTALNQMTLS